MFTMKHLLLTTIAAVLLVGCGNPEADRALRLAARKGDIEAVKKSIADGADVNAKSESGTTPLQRAAQYGEKEVVELLISKGADLSAKEDIFGKTPLHYAAEEGHKETLKLLIDKGADVHAGDKDGDSPLAWAVYSNHMDIVKLLIAAGADVNVKNNKYGWTPLYSATGGGHKKITELLIDKGADVNAKDDTGMTPLHYEAMSWAAYHGHKEIVELLIAKGADVDAKGDDGRTPLDWAVDLGYTELADLLRKHAGKTSEELFALFKAAAKGNIEAVKQHLDGGADVNAKDGGGWTPLHFAAWFGHTEVAELLIAKGADVNAKDHTGRTPLNEAIETNQTKTADLLRTHGGKTGIEHVEDRLNSLNETLSQLQHLIIGDDAGVDPDKPSIEKLQGVFVIRGKVGGKYEVQYHTGDNNWQVREEITLTANRQLYIDSSSYDEKRFYRVKQLD